MQTAVIATSTRILIQNALQRYNSGNNTDTNWARANQDLQVGIGGGGLLSSFLQARVVSKNGTGVAGPYGLINVTATTDVPIPLPATHANGTQVYLGDPDNDGLGYPSNLYPNLTFTSTVFNDTFNVSTAYFEGKMLYENTTIFLGPWVLNETFALASITVPVNNNTSTTDVLGWLTMVIDCSLIYSIVSKVEGLGETGQALIIGPNTPDNRLAGYAEFDNNNDSINRATAEDESVVFVFPPLKNTSRSNRQSSHTFGNPNTPFSMRKYPAVLDAYTKDNGVDRNAGSMISAKNEDDTTVSVGYALPLSAMVDWVLIVEQSHKEVTAPITKLRNILLICVFGTTGFLLLLLFPVAHLSVLPIRRLREATKKTVEPYQIISDDGGSVRSYVSRDSDASGSGMNEEQAAEARKEGFFGRAIHWRSRHHQKKFERQEMRRRQTFRIPGKVKDRKHFVQDELTDLTTTFNEMSEELMMQYERLEERVKERTAELEISKRAAEAANESKTLFIANISHELKTPLNGILGMCAVCMQEDEPSKIKRSLGIIYKSGDLLLHLLTDLLTFSKNQIGQQLTLEEKEFRLAEVSAQVLSIFEKQAREGSIKLALQFQGPLDAMESSVGSPIPSGLGPFGTGRVRDMSVWGDQHRILQVIINLVSNSLKFTPPGGTVNVRVRCLGEAPPERAESRKGSLQSKRSKQASSRPTNRKGRVSSGTSSSASPKLVQRDSSKYSDTALQINRAEPKAIASVLVRERSSSPPPANARPLVFEFEVEDTGPGIPEAQQQRVFEPFMQGDLGLSKKYGGTGLGLSICSQLATLMRGSISLKSEVGVGSKFTMRIPLLFIKERADSLRSSNANPGSQRNSINLGNGDDSRAHTPHKNRSSDDVSVKSVDGGAPLNGFDTPAKPRLVGLSQPFFAATSPLESPDKQLAAMEKAAAQASKDGDKVRVLVAEDNKVNQEVVLRMLKLEDIYGSADLTPLNDLEANSLQMLLSPKMARKPTILSRRVCSSQSSST